MSYKDKALAALEQLEVTCEGLIAATRRSTILECIDIIQSIPDDEAQELTELSHRLDCIRESSKMMRSELDAVRAERDKLRYDYDSVSAILKGAEATLNGVESQTAEAQVRMGMLSGENERVWKLLYMIFGGKK